MTGQKFFSTTHRQRYREELVFIRALHGHTANNLDISTFTHRKIEESYTPPIIFCQFCTHQTKHHKADMEQAGMAMRTSCGQIARWRMARWPMEVVFLFLNTWWSSRFKTSKRTSSLETMNTHLYELKNHFQHWVVDLGSSLKRISCAERGGVKKRPHTNTLSPLRWRARCFQDTHMIFVAKPHHYVLYTTLPQTQHLRTTQRTPLTMALLDGSALHVTGPLSVHSDLSLPTPPNLLVSPERYASQVRSRTGTRVMTWELWIRISPDSYPSQMTKTRVQCLNQMTHHSPSRQKIALKVYRRSMTRSSIDLFKDRDKQHERNIVAKLPTWSTKSRATTHSWTSSGKNLKGQLENTEKRHRNTFRNRPLESKLKRQLIWLHIFEIVIQTLKRNSTIVSGVLISEIHDESTLALEAQGGADGSWSSRSGVQKRHRVVLELRNELHRHQQEAESE